MWVTRARPKVDRIACPWLIRRFVDPEAVILYVAPADVAGVAERFGAAPFDIDGAKWSDRDGLCTFDALVRDLGLTGFPALLRLAEIVRGADTGRPDLTPQSGGLLAASLGLSRMHSDDLEQLEDGMIPTMRFTAGAAMRSTRLTTPRSTVRSGKTEVRNPRNANPARRW